MYIRYDEYAQTHTIIVLMEHITSSREKCWDFNFTSGENGVIPLSQAFDYLNKSKQNGMWFTILLTDCRVPFMGFWKPWHGGSYGEMLYKHIEAMNKSVCVCILLMSSCYLYTAETIYGIHTQTRTFWTVQIWIKDTIQKL